MSETALSGPTPGEWVANPKGQRVMVRGDDGRWVILADVRALEGPAANNLQKARAAQRRANGRLMAAAPDLLAACKAVADAASEIILLADKATNAGAAHFGTAATLKRLVLAAIAKTEGQ